MCYKTGIFEFNIKFAYLMLANPGFRAIQITGLQPHDFWGGGLCLLCVV
jgi:hypothetical protein